MAKLELSYTATGDIQHAVTLGNSLAVPQRAKHRVAI